MTIDNPYWDAVKDHVGQPAYDWSDGKSLGEVGGGFREDGVTAWRLRNECTARYAWTIPHPDTVAFIAAHARGQVIDPIAGTGYWCYLLGQAGVDCQASDLYPHGGTVSPEDGITRHQEHPSFVAVAQADAVEAVTVAHPARTLLLSWPPYGDPLAEQVLRAYGGERVIFIGEGEGGCTGTDEFFAMLIKDFDVVAAHIPVQYFGLHDTVTVWDRKPIRTLAVEGRETTTSGE